MKVFKVSFFFRTFPNPSILTWQTSKLLARYTSHKTLCPLWAVKLTLPNFSSIINQTNNLNSSDLSTKCTILTLNKGLTPYIGYMVNGVLLWPYTLCIWFSFFFSCILGCFPMIFPNEEGRRGTLILFWFPFDVLGWFGCLIMLCPYESMGNWSLFFLRIKAVLARFIVETVMGMSTVIVKLHVFMVQCHCSSVFWYQQCSLIR